MNIPTEEYGVSDAFMPMPRDDGKTGNAAADALLAEMKLEARMAEFSRMMTDAPGTVNTKEFAAFLLENGEYKYSWFADGCTGQSYEVAGWTGSFMVDAEFECFLPSITHCVRRLELDYGWIQQQPLLPGLLI